jgi:glycosyltransferase involved in cell wall biosynthesis
MLMQDLGYRAPHPAEEAEIRARVTEAKPTRGWRSAGRVPAAVLHDDPLISFSGHRREVGIGLPNIVGRRLRGRAAWFLISPTWTIEGDEPAKLLRELAVLHRSRNPEHRLIFICNTPEEVDGLQKFGEAAFFYNKTANVPDWIFKPLDGAEPEFDAIYNAQLVPWKRQELSLGIESCAFLFHRGLPQPDSAASEKAIIAQHAAAAPGHVFINRFGKGSAPVRLPPAEVNRHLNRARIGLCLSEKEGPMLASSEYLLSGLPIVSTPSVGGRHIYFDEEFCLVVSADPSSVAEAVDALKAKGIPRGYVREKTLKRMEQDRARFLALLNAILEESGAEPRFSMPWPFRKPVLMEWLRPEDAAERAALGIVDGFEKKKRKRGALGWRRWGLRLRAMAR